MNLENKKIESRISELEELREKMKLEIEGISEDKKQCESQNIERLKKGEPITGENPYAIQRVEKTSLLGEIEVALQSLKTDQTDRERNRKAPGNRQGIELKNRKKERRTLADGTVRS